MNSRPECRPKACDDDPLDPPHSIPFVVRPRFKMVLVQIVLLEAVVVFGFLFALGMRTIYAKWLSMQFPPEPAWGLTQKDRQ